MNFLPRRLTHRRWRDRLWFLWRRSDHLGQVLQGYRPRPDRVRGFDPFFEKLFITIATYLSATSRFAIL